MRSRSLLYFLTFLCMANFGMNSILCRAALVWYGMGPLQYTAIRCLSGAVMLALICSLRLADRRHVGTVKEAFREAFSQSSWLGGAFLFGYMFCFSLCYVDMPAAAGTLILNVSVQFGMLGWGIWAGMRPNGGQTAGLFLATGGLVALLMPGLEVPPLVNGLLMMGSGLCWRGYSLCGRRSTSAGLATVGNFLRASVFALAAGLSALYLEAAPSLPALCCALTAGALCSGLGYILWYAIVTRYTLVASSVIQLSVPILTAFMGLWILDETLTVRLAVCSVLILGGICLTVLAGARR